MRLPSVRRTAAPLALVLALGAAACGGDDEDPQVNPSVTLPETTTTQATTTTVEETGPVAPLTGIPTDDEEVLSRPALMVKIGNNDEKARPQTGINQADIVYEEIVEGGRTRFAAVFQSTIPDAVGTVRSARSSDAELLMSLNRPLFANSGSNAGVRGEMNALERDGHVIIVNHESSAGSLYYRTNDRPRPDNLYVNPNDLYALELDTAGPPPPQFTFREEGDELPDTAQPIGGVVVTFRNRNRVAEHYWDEAVGGWVRVQDGTLHVDNEGVEIAPENVLVLSVPYGISAADPSSPEAETVGAGLGYVLTDGHAILVQWSRDDATQPFTLLDAAGDPVALTPGRTWILLADVDDSVIEPVGAEESAARLAEVRQ